jgi:hypothetical protein
MVRSQENPEYKMEAPATEETEKKVREVRASTTEKRNKRSQFRQCNMSKNSRFQPCNCESPTSQLWEGKG